MLFFFRFWFLCLKNCRWASFPADSVWHWQCFGLWYRWEPVCCYYGNQFWSVQKISGRKCQRFVLYSFDFFVFYWLSFGNLFNVSWSHTIQFIFNLFLKVFYFTAIFVFQGMFSKLLKTADKFLEKFNIRRLKFGTIMEFLTKFSMTDSMTAMGEVLREIKVFSSSW